MNRFLAACLALLFASLTVSSTCLAAPIDQSAVLVRYGDLDLSTLTGRQTLHRRTEVALNQVCLDPNGPSPASTVDIACKIDGRHAAQAQIAIAVAQQTARQPMAGTEVSIRILKPLPHRLSVR
jgi:UrcA family protein